MASIIVYAFWGRNGSGELVEPEMRFAMTADFRRAVLDDDGLLHRPGVHSKLPDHRCDASSHPPGPLMSRLGWGEVLPTE